MKKSCFLLLVLCLSGTILAQAPQKMSYQAVIRNNTNLLVTSTAVGMRISILQGSIFGPSVYVETQNPMTNANGLVSLEIGSGTPIIGSLATINWANGPYFIKTETDPTGGIGYSITGTSELMSVPYALFSANGTPGPAGANGTDGLSAYEIAVANGYVGTEAQWLTSLEGPQGLQGPAGNDGAQGTQGAQGPAGANGTDGLSAYEIAVANGYVGTEAQWLTSLEGPQGLQGPAGNDGALNAWSLSGNAGTSDNVNFIGTTDDTPFNIKVNNEKAGRIDHYSNNSFWGYLSGNSNNTGNNNTAIGASSLRFNTSGLQNTASGAFALYNNTTGQSNTANGYGALFYNNGFYNTAVGNSALSDNYSGQSNTGLGSNALRYNYDGDNNTAVGSSALNQNTSGYQNTASGSTALFLNTIGYWNTASGYMALYSNTAGSYNTAHGVAALYSNIGGYYNTSNGVYSLYNNSDGTENTANGYRALYSNTLGSFNTAVGVNSMNSNTIGEMNASYGYQSFRENTQGSYNTAIGSSSLSGNISGNSNTAIGYGALGSVTSGNNNIGLGTDANVPDGAGSNQVRIGNTSITYAGIQVAWTTTSDKRWKSNIVNIPLGLDFVGQLRPVSYYRTNDVTKRIEYGFIAQEIEEVLNNLGAENNGIISKDDEGMYGVRYNDLIAPIVKAIQELNSTNIALQKEIELLKKKNEAIQKDLEKLKMKK